MTKNDLTALSSFQDLVTEMVEVLRRFPSPKEAAAISDERLRAAQTRLAELEAAAMTGALSGPPDLGPFLEMIGMDEAGFSASAERMHAAARNVLADRPHIATAPGAARRRALKRALAAHPDAVRLVSSVAGLPEAQARRAFLLDDIPDDLGTGLSEEEECKLACDLLFALEIVMLIIVAVERALKCATIAAFPGLAILCLFAVGVIYLVGGKAAEKALQECYEDCASKHD